MKRIFAALCLIWCSTSAFAIELNIPSAYENYRRDAKVNEDFEQLSHNFSGESIDYFSGNVTFNITDVSIPGNFNIPVAITRFTRTESLPDGVTFSSGYNFNLANWDIALPSVEARVAEVNHMYCGMDRPPEVKDETYDRYVFTWSDYYNGLTFNSGSGDSTSIFKVYGNNKPSFIQDQNVEYYTKDKWLFYCDGDVFLAKSPEGFTYTFGKKRLLTAPVASKSINLPGSSEAEDVSISTTSVRYQVTKVHDRHGNYVSYGYSSDGLLESINSSDGRDITIEYKSYSYPGYSNRQVVDKVHANGKVWKYEYDTNRLSKVILPDNNYWQYEGSLEFNMPKNVDIQYDNAIPAENQEYTFTIKHPYGALAEFTFKQGWLHRLGYEYKAFNFCWYYPGGIGSDPLMCSSTKGKDCHSLNCRSRIPSVAVVKKTSTINGEVSTWSYSIEQFSSKTPDHYQGEYSQLGDPKPEEFTQEVVSTGPVGKEVRTFWRYRDEREGELLSTKHFDLEGRELKSVTEEYGVDEYYYSHVKCVDNTGEPSQYSSETNCSQLAKKRRVTKVTKSFKDENGGVDHFNVEYLAFDSYGANTLNKVSFSGNTRYEKLTYNNFPTHWVLGLPARTYISSTSQFVSPYKEILYNSNLLPSSENLFGVHIKSYEYYGDGSLKKTTYEGTNRYEYFQDYFRGKARILTLPCPQVNGCDTENNSTSNTLIAKFDVNSDGTFSSVTDFKGNKTNYTYNPIGWLESIDYVDSMWVDKIIEYSSVTIDGDGIDGSDIKVGQIKKKVTHGDFESIIYYDSLLRPILTRTRDITDRETITYQRNEYDAESRITLATFPSDSASNRFGMKSEYDVLGRVITQTRTSDNAITRHEYLAGNKTRITDPLGNQVSTTYLAYGEPAYEKPTLIEAPDTDNTRLTYNLFDQIESIAQGSITERRYYDDRQQLCKTVRPETGITAYGYNTQRQPIWRALGTQGSSTSCDASTVPTNHKVTLGYDNLGQLYTENFPDDTPDKTYSYDGNGNLTRLQSGDSIWDYDYNSLNIIEKETLTLDGKSFELDWVYNSLGAVSSLKYPSGHTVDFSPNALGQPTKAGNYTSSVKYHPNGQLSSFTYGNGVVRNIALDTTGRIDSIIDSKGENLISLDPSYDDNDNLAVLIDRVDRRNDIDTLTYDGMNRLLTANGRWGTGRYSYDGLGNIKSRNLNGSIITYHYNDALNRLERLSGAYAYGYQYDSRGNVIQNGRYSLDYNLGQQMTAAKGIGYQYDGHNRRVRKTENGRTSYSVYSQGGQLLFRLSDDGTQTDSIYLGKTIVAEVDRK